MQAYFLLQRLILYLICFGCIPITSSDSREAEFLFVFVIPCCYTTNLSLALRSLEESMERMDPKLGIGDEDNVRVNSSAISFDNGRVSTSSTISWVVLITIEETAFQ